MPQICFAGKNEGAHVKNSTFYTALSILFAASATLSSCTDPRSTTFIAMPDGVELRTEITEPEGFPDSGPYPVILVRSPYGRETERTEADKWRAKGYVFVMQEIRGTSGSADPNLRALFAADGWGAQQDGKVTVDWLLTQPWCNTQIATLGFSGPALGGTLLSGATQDLGAQVIERSPASVYGQGAFVGGVPKGELDPAFWNPGELWQEHPSYDAFWATQDAISRAPFITAPALHIGGWYDLFLQGAIDGFTSRQENGGSGAKGNQKLIVGPWTHDNERQAGAVTFPNSLLEASPLGQTRDQLRAQFVDFWLRGEGTEPDFTVLYYTMGALGESGAPGNEWRFAETWPPLPYTLTPAYLAADSALDVTVPAAGSSLTFTYNPNNPVPSRGGQLLFGGGVDDQAALTARPDVIDFYTTPLGEAIEVTGPITVRLYVSTNAVDTDFTAKLVDLYPNNVQFNVADGIRRLRYRESYAAVSENVPGTVYVLDIDLWSTSYVFNVGHRIGIHVSSSNNPRFLPNPNNGNLLVEEGTPLTAQNTVHFGGATPSAIYLPVVND
jgi:predicted acyl esterase